MADDVGGGPAAAPAPEPEPDQEPHREPHPDLAGYVLGVLDPADAAAFETHLRGCPRCRAEASDLQPLTSALDQAAPAVDLPPGLAVRTFAAIERAAASDHRAGEGDTASGRGDPRSSSHAAGSPPASDNPGSSHASSSPPVSDNPGSSHASSSPPVSDHQGNDHQGNDHQRSGRRIRRGTGRAALGIGVAAVAVAAAVALVVGLWPSPGPAPDARVALASDVAGRTGTVALRRTDSGVVIDLAVNGLAPSRGGEHYECWYVSAGDAPGAPDRISAGTFTVGADGRAHVQMVTAADPAEYPRIIVSREALGGDPNSMGKPVLWSRWTARRPR